MYKDTPPERHLIFPPDGFWEITWLGPVSYRRGRGQFSIQVVLSERAHNPFKRGDLGKGYTGKVVVKTCGVGELANLAVGVIAKDRKILPDEVANKARRKYHAEENFTDIILDRIDPDTVLDEGVSEATLAPETVGPFRDTPCAVLYSRSRHERILIPHIELIRALFAGSGDFLKAILQGTLCKHGQPAKAIFQIEKSFVDVENPRRVCIVAGRRLKVKEAQIAALLHAHPEFWASVQSIFPQFQVNGIATGEPVYTRATWQHFEISELSGTVQTLFFNNENRDVPEQENVARATYKKVLTRVRDIKIAPPYDEVIVLHPVHSAAPGQAGIQRFHLAEFRPKEIDIQDEIDPSLNHGGRVFVESQLLGESLRSLADMLVKHMHVVKSTGPVTVTIPRPEGERMIGSTADPGFGSGEIAVVDFILPEEGRPPTNLAICRRIYAAAQATQLLAQEVGGTAYEVVAGCHSPISLPPQCVTFPIEHQGIELPWSMYDDELGWVRRAFVGLLVVNGLRFYIFDAEIDRDEQDNEASTLLILLPHGNVELDHIQITSLLAALSKKRGTWPRKDLPGISDYVVHSDNRLAGELMASEIGKRLRRLAPAITNAK